MRLLPLAILIVIPFIAFGSQGAENASGIWKWSIPLETGQSREIFLTLKQDATNLTGWITSYSLKKEISDGRIKGDEVTFTITSRFAGKDVITKYSGKIQGDKLIGKSLLERPGKIMETSWTAEREPAKPQSIPTK